MGYALAAIALIGAGTAAYGAYSSSKGSGQSMPGPGQVLGNANDYADAQYSLDKRQAQLALSMYPQFAAEQLAAQGGVLRQALSYYPDFANAEIKATSRVRGQDLADFQKNSGGWASQLDRIAPGYAQLGAETARGNVRSPLLDYLNGQALTAGPSQLRNNLQQSALYQLSLGGSLTPQEERDATQTARAGWADRGLANSNPAVASEVLNRDYLANQRLMQREGFAQNAWQVGQTEDAANRGFGVSVQGANEASQGNWRNFLVAASQAEVNPIIQASMQRTPVSPYGMFGGTGSAPSPYGVSSVFSTAPQIASYIPGISNLYADNLAVAESRANASASAWSALGGGLMSLGGAGMGGGSRGGGGGYF